MFFSSESLNKKSKGFCYALLGEDEDEEEEDEVDADGTDGIKGLNRLGSKSFFLET